MERSPSQLMDCGRYGLADDDSYILVCRTRVGQNQALSLAADLCRFFEGFSSQPYICPAGYPTIGYGTVYKPDGIKVTMQDQPISRELANEWLMRELQHNYMAGVLKASPTLITNQRLLAAVTDFAYNLGVGRYRASTLKRRVDANDLLGIETELKKWNRGGGRVLPGLVKRRQAEIDLIRSGTFNR